MKTRQKDKTDNYINTRKLNTAHLDRQIVHALVGQIIFFCRPPVNHNTPSGRLVGGWAWLTSVMLDAVKEYRPTFRRDVGDKIVADDLRLFL